jgi:hypothetical protein
MPDEMDFAMGETARQDECGVCDEIGRPTRKQRPAGRGIHPPAFTIKSVVGHAPSVWNGLVPERGRVPGKRIGTSRLEVVLSYENIHRGEACCIIANGLSVKEVDLSKISCLTIGVNKAWMLRDCDYYCIGDPAQFKFYEKERGDVTKLRPLFSVPSGPEHAVRIHCLHDNVKRFSFDLTGGIYLNNTITAYALQLAHWMGFTTVYLIGVDCIGKHFDGGNTVDEKKFSNQRETFGYIAGILEGMGDEMEIINLNTKSWCWSFPKQKFETVFP